MINIWPVYIVHYLLTLSKSNKANISKRTDSCSNWSEMNYLSHFTSKSSRSHLPLIYTTCPPKWRSYFTAKSSQFVSECVTSHFSPTRHLDLSSYLLGRDSRKWRFYTNVSECKVGFLSLVDKTKVSLTRGLCESSRLLETNDERAYAPPPVIDIWLGQFSFCPVVLSAHSTIWSRYILGSSTKETRRGWI